MINLKKYSTGLIQKDGILFSKLESKVSYPSFGNEINFKIEEKSFWFNHRNNCIIEGVLKYCPKSVFFDIGGGNGFVAKGLENKAILTVLVEPGIEGCLNAKKRNLNNIVCSTLENASFKTNALPAIGLFDVVEHINDDVDFLTNVFRLLIDGGFIFITVPAFKRLWSNEDVEAGHFRRYTRKEMEKKLKKIGFKIEYSTYIFSVLLLAVFLFRVLPTKLGFKKSLKKIKNINKDHEIKKGIIGKILNLIWKIELKKIKLQKTILFGGSCFIIARKVVEK